MGQGNVVGVTGFEPNPRNCEKKGQLATSQETQILQDFLLSQIKQRLSGTSAGQGGSPKTDQSGIIRIAQLLNHFQNLDEDELELALEFIEGLKKRKKAQ